MVKMEIGDEKAEENARFAFLLGSALRNEDADQFLQVYDTIVPKDFPPEKVAGLKDRARVIASLSEDEYNDLVTQARDFSLALCTWEEETLTPPSQALRTVAPSSGQPQQSEANIDALSTVASSGLELDMEQVGEDAGGGAGKVKPVIESLSRTSRYFSTGICDPEDGDSGVFNSSKATTGSYASEDCDSNDEERGVFHYINDSTTIKKRPTLTAKASTRAEIIHQHDKAYDDAFEADSDTEKDEHTHSGHITKFTNKYDKDLQGTEMNTFSYEEKERAYESPDEGSLHMEYSNQVMRSDNDRQYDEAFSCVSSQGSDDELHSVRVVKPGCCEDDIDNLVNNKVNVHERLYGQLGSYQKVEDPTSDDEECEELPLYDPTRPSAPMKIQSRGSVNSLKSTKEKPLSFPSASTYRTTRDYGTINRGNVDSGIPFFTSASTYHSMSSSPPATYPLTSVGVRVDKTEKQRTMGSPPFDYPPDKRKLLSSAERLLDTNKGSRDMPSNLPQAAPIRTSNTHSSFLNREPGSSSDTEKKKRKKKKKSQSEVSESKDENGNPLELGQASQDKSRSSRSPNGRQEATAYSSVFPSNFPGLEPYMIQREEMAAHGGVSSSSSSAAHNSNSEYLSKKQRSKHKKEKAQENVVKAEQIPGHRYTEDLDDLLNFIDGGSKTGKRRSNSGSSSLSATAASNTVISTQSMGQNSSSDLAPEPINHKLPGAQDARDKQAEGLPELSHQHTHSRRKKKKSTNSSKLQDDVFRSSSDNGDDKSSRNGDGGRSSISEGSSVSADMLKEVTSMAAARDLLSPESRCSPPVSSTNNYIFTDLPDPVKKADSGWSEVVTHKKKRAKAGNNNNVVTSYVSTNNHRDFYAAHTFSAKDTAGQPDNSAPRYQDYNAKRRSHQPFSSSYRGATPPTESVVPQERSWATANERSFSPSGFPVLGRGRRNSTGSADLGNGDGDMDSSDLESVQSVPTKLTGGGGTSQATNMSSASSSHSNMLETTPSPQGPPPISYASIAAGGLKGNKLVLEEEDHRALSPCRERRRSEGSLPLVPVVEPSLAEQHNPEIARSHEFPSITKASLSPTSPSPLLVTSHSDPASQPQDFEPVDNTLPPVALQNISAQPSPTPTSDTTLLSNSTSTVTCLPEAQKQLPPLPGSATDNAENKVNNSSNAIAPVILPQTAPPVSDCSVDNSAQTRAPSGAVSSKPPKAPLRQKKQVNKPVIFLDTRQVNNVQQPRNNLGLSFGFEPDIKNELDNNLALGNSRNASYVITENLANNNMNMHPSCQTIYADEVIMETGARNNNISAEHSGSQGNDLTFLQQDASPLPPADQGLASDSVISEISVINDNISSSCSIGVVDDENSSSNKKSLLPPGQHPPNGIVIPTNSAVVAVVTDNHDDADKAPKSSHSQPDTNQPPCKPSLVPPAEPAENKLLAAIMATGQKHVTANDPNFIPGNFDVHGARVWLYSCFQDVLNEKAERPGRVMEYAS